MLNPVGFSLEGYDSWGMTRTTENRFNENGQVVATFPVQTSVGRTYLIDDKGLEVQSLSDALGLRDTVAKGPASKSCFAQRVFEFQRVNTMSADDLCSLNEGEQAARSSSIQDVLINSIANEDIFWRAKGN